MRKEKKGRLSWDRKLAKKNWDKTEWTKERMNGNDRTKTDVREKWRREENQKAVGRND